MVTVTSRTPVSLVAGLTCFCQRNRGSYSNCPCVFPALTPSTPSIMASRSPANRTAVSRSAAAAEACVIAPRVRTPALIPIASTTAATSTSTSVNPDRSLPIPLLHPHHAGVRCYDDPQGAPTVVGQNHHSAHGPPIRREPQRAHGAAARGGRRRGAVEWLGHGLQTRLTLRRQMDQRKGGRQRHDRSHRRL